MSYGNDDDNSLKITGYIILGLGVAAIAGMRFCGNVSGENKTTAEDEARKYAAALGLTVQGVECARNDSDNDGYVSCTLAVKQPSGEVAIEPIECAVKYTTNEGCRVQKPSIRAR
ncbi:MAG: hypothetical protein ACHREM_06595 [Polyangiales bacterium]